MASRRDQISSLAAARCGQSLPLSPPTEPAPEKAGVLAHRHPRQSSPLRYLPLATSRLPAANYFLYFHSEHPLNSAADIQLDSIPYLHTLAMTRLKSTYISGTQHTRSRQIVVPAVVYGSETAPNDPVVEMANGKKVEHRVVNGQEPTVGDVLRNGRAQPAQEGNVYN